MLRIACVTVLLGGCAIDDTGDYIDARASSECNRIQRCDLGFFESEYNSDEDCLDDVTERLDAVTDIQKDADCTYIPEEAGRCVRRVRRMACEEWAEGEIGGACDLVWDCTGGGS